MSFDLLMQFIAKENDGHQTKINLFDKIKLTIKLMNTSKVTTAQLFGHCKRYGDKRNYSFCIS